MSLVKLLKDCFTHFLLLLLQSSQPLGAVSLLHYTVTRSAFTDRPHGLLLSKGGTIRHWLAAESTDSVEQWQSVFNYASKAAIQVVTRKDDQHDDDR